MESITITVTKQTVTEVEMDIALFRKVICRRKKGEEETAYLNRSQKAWDELVEETNGSIEVEAEQEEDYAADEEEVIREVKEDIREYM
jgi:hypothetical protein